MSDQLKSETITEEVHAVVTETVTSPVVEAGQEAVPEVVQEEKKTKSFFSIFKKEKEPVEADPATVETVEGETSYADAVVEGEATPIEEVPVETTPAKKRRYCGLCCLGKKDKAKESTEAEAAAVEEAATTEEAIAATEEVLIVEEPVVVAEEEGPVVEEAAPEEVAVADEAAAETTEGEAIALVDAADVVRSGALFKSGKFFKSNMNERYCRLLSTGVFQWSKTEDFTHAHECKISGETTTVAFMAEGEETPHKYRFELHCCSSVSTYAVDTEEDRDEWIRAFETVKESIVPIVVAEEEALFEDAPTGN